jgi:TPR repeat protein
MTENPNIKNNREIVLVAVQQKDSASLELQKSMLDSQKVSQVLLSTSATSSDTQKTHDSGTQSTQAEHKIPDSIIASTVNQSLEGHLTPESRPKLLINSPSYRARRPLQLENFHVAREAQSLPPTTDRDHALRLAPRPDLADTETTVQGSSSSSISQPDSAPIYRWQDAIPTEIQALSRLQTLNDSHLHLLYLYVWDHGYTHSAPRQQLLSLANQGQKYPLAQAYISNLLYQGQSGFPKDPARALEYVQRCVSQIWEMADQGNNLYAQCVLGRIYRSGRGVTENLVLSFQWYEKAAHQGFPLAQERLGSMYLYGEGTPQNLDQARKWIQKAINQEDKYAKVVLADMYRKGQDYTKAREIYQELAESLPIALDRLADMYQKGQGIDIDLEHALVLYKQAALQGYIEAVAYLGDIYRKGQLGQQSNHAEALKWYTIGVDAGDGRAMYVLGRMYEDGQVGKSKDPTKALEWFQKATDADYSPAAYYLGWMYQNGKLGQPKDLVESFKWYQRAAQLGYSSGMTMLGALYADGAGVEKKMTKQLNGLPKARRLEIAGLVML